LCVTENTDVGFVPNARPTLNRSVTLPRLVVKPQPSDSPRRLRPGQQPAPPTTLHPRQIGIEKRENDIKLNALNRTFDPIPRLLEKKNEVKRKYKTIDLQIWKNQVKK